MKLFRKLLVVMVATLGVLLMTGCGGQIDTEMNLGENWSGSRHMVFSANIADNASYIHGDYESIAATVEQNCPAQLEMTAVNDGTDYIFTFDLYFSSQEEYENKVSQLLEASGHEAPETFVNYVTPESIFANGVSYQEYFSTQDLMDWFPTLLVNAGYIDSSDRSNIFKSGGCSYNIQGVTGDGLSYYSDINVNTIAYQPINGITIYHSSNADGTFDRKIVVSIPQSTMDAVGEEVKAFLTSSTSNVGTASWSSDNGINYYTIEASGISADQVNTMMAAFCGTSETVFSLEDMSAQAGNKNLFFVNSIVNEKLPLQNYISNSYSEVNLNYLVADDAVYNGQITTPGGTGDLYTYNSDTEGFYTLFTTRSFDSSVRYTSEMSYTVKTANISLNIKGAGNVSRSVELYFTEEIGQAAADALKSRLEAAFGESALKVAVCESVGKGLHVILETNCPAGEEAKTWNDIFGTGNRLFVSTNSNAILTTKKITSVSDSFSMVPFTTQNIETVNYEIKNIGDTTVYGGDAKTNVGSSYVKTYSAVYPNTLTNEVVGVKTNILGYVVLVVIGLLALNAIIQILRLVFGGKKASKQKAAASEVKAEEMPAKAEPEAAPAPENEPVTRIAEEPVKMEAKPRFCENCGAKIVDPDTRFCEKCGAKLGEE